MKHKRLLIAVLTLFIQLSLTAQTEIKAQADIGGAKDDNLSSMVLTKDGGILIAGTSLSDTSQFKSQNSIGGFDFWISKYKRDTATGALRKIWDKTVGTTLNDYLSSCVPTRDGGCILAGYKQDQSYSIRTRILFKLDRQGNIKWSDTSVVMPGFNISVDATNDNGFIMIQDSAYFTVSVTKMDSSGNQQWKTSISKWYYDIVNSVKQTPDGGYFIAGTYTDFFELLPYLEIRPYLIRLDKLGNISWTKKYSSIGNVQQAAQGFEVLITKDNNILLYGKYASSYYYYGYYDDVQWDNWRTRFNKLDNQGNVIWNADEFLYTDGGVEHHDLGLTKDSGFIFGFSAKYGYKLDYYYNSDLSDYYFQKYNSKGQKEWTDSVAGNYTDNIATILEISPRHYMIGGTSNSGLDSVKTKANLGYNDFWLVTVADTTKNNSIIRKSSLSNTGQTLLNNISLDPNPLKGDLHLHTKNKATFSVINQEGKIVLSIFINEKGGMSMQQLPAGLYYLRNNATLEITKVMIQ